jgi:endonuclease G
MRYKTLYIITGGVLVTGLDKIGDEDVAVPDHFYKVIAKENKGDLNVLAFLMKGEEQNKPLQKFVVPLDRIEELTGIDFFHEINKEAQASIEHDVVLKNWKF